MGHRYTGDFHTEVRCEFPPALTVKFKAAIMAWCKYNVKAENLDRSVPHLESPYIQGEAMPHPQYAGECQRAVGVMHRATIQELRHLNLATDDVKKAERIALRMPIDEASSFCGVELLPLNRNKSCGGTDT